MNIVESMTYGRSQTLARERHIPPGKGQKWWNLQCFYRAYWSGSWQGLPCTPSAMKPHA